MKSIAIVLLVFALPLTVSRAAAETSPILQCLESRMVKGKLQLTHHLEVSGDVVSRNDWAITCTGATAERIWDAAFPLRTADPVQIAEATHGKALMLKLGHNSRCYKPQVDPDQPAPPMSCDLYLDLTDDLLQSEFVSGP